VRIFHFGNISPGIEQLSSGGKDITGGGGWTAALIGQMLERTNFEFAYAAFGDVEEVQKIHNGRIDYYVVPKRLGDAGRHYVKGLSVCRDLTESWKPDLIHIHGTEGPFGLLTARGEIRTPAVISMQGLLGPCSEWYRFFGNHETKDILRMHRWDEVLTLRGLWKGFRQINRRAEREKEIIAGNQYFMGRTDWDEAYVRALNPSAHYYKEGRILRDAFWHKRWNIGSIRRHRIIFTNAKHPRKGTESLLKAASLLRPKYPDIEVAVAGGLPGRSGYGMYLRGRFRECGGIVTELGALNAEQMAEELARSHVFVSPSYIDNSPNALSEAQLVGMPVISTYTGGVPSLIEHGITGLFAPTGDAPMLAYRLEQVFENDGLASRLGNEARNVAMARHDPTSVTDGVMGIYSDVARMEGFVS
jgi:glycosyltransferase involved in cell wall biosynthesis